jgi:predicted nuclease of predicted toxin-antitoxin system
LKIGDFKVLTDENIHGDVVSFLRSSGMDVLDVQGEGLQGSTDEELLIRAMADQRVVFTHDSDFGTLTILGGQQMVGIIYLRPGHIDPKFTIESIEAVLNSNLDFEPPFILVAHRKGSKVALRLRTF